LPPSQQTDVSLDYFSAAGEGLECVEIARRLHASAAAGVAFDSTAILLRSPERYLPLLEEALRRAGIPAYFSHGTARPDQAGRAFLALLACASERCSASRFAEYLSLSQVPQIDESGAPVRVERQ
jgi:superfamily I DNA/RNA helicase